VQTIRTSGRSRASNSNGTAIRQTGHRHLRCTPHGATSAPVTSSAINASQAGADEAAISGVGRVVLAHPWWRRESGPYPRSALSG
jgi:hypothetical protein